MKNPLIPILLTALCSLGFFPATAQVESFAGDSTYRFFKQAQRHYQRWLDASGLGAKLMTDTFQLKKSDTELELLLVLRTSDPDTAVGLWKELRRAYAASVNASNDTLALETALFDAFAHQFQVPPAQGNVQIYLRDRRGNYVPCFYVWIWRENGELNMQMRLNQCKAKTFEVEVRTVQLKKGKNGKMVEVMAPVPPSKVFDEILRFAREEYEKTDCYDRKPKVDVNYDRTKNNKLVFNATDLCRKVLVDEKKSYWCRLMDTMGVNCNDIKRERLEFEFVYVPLDKGYQLSCTLRGLFGSGFYKPRIAGYMDMEPDFDDYLTTYKNDFQRRLQERLNKLRP